MSVPCHVCGYETGTCRKCGYAIERIAGTWVAMSDDTADGLSYCPPNPDARGTGVHVPRREKE